MPRFAREAARSGGVRRVSLAQFGCGWEKGSDSNVACLNCPVVLVGELL